MEAAHGPGALSWTRRSARRRGGGRGWRWWREGLIDPVHYYGTINCNGINAKGEICGVTTTSGLAWKIPGRVGDSPILGAGLYVDGDIGAAGSTGRGEANLFSLCSFLIVLRAPGSLRIAGLDLLSSTRVRERSFVSRAGRAPPAHDPARAGDGAAFAGSFAG